MWWMRCKHLQVYNVSRTFDTIYLCLQSATSSAILLRHAVLSSYCSKRGHRACLAFNTAPSEAPIQVCFVLFFLCDQVFPARHSEDLSREQLEDGDKRQEQLDTLLDWKNQRNRTRL